MATKGYTDEILSLDSLTELGAATEEELRSILLRVQKNSVMPMHLRGSGSTLLIAGNQLPLGDGAIQSTGPDEEKINEFVGGLIDFTTGVSTSNVVRDGEVFALPAATTGKYSIIALKYQSEANRVDTFFAEPATLIGDLANPGEYFSRLSGVSLGYLIIQKDVVGWHTVGSPDGVIENNASLFRFRGLEPGLTTVVSPLAYSDTLNGEIRGHTVDVRTIDTINLFGWNMSESASQNVDPWNGGETLSLTGSLTQDNDIEAVSVFNKLAATTFLTNAVVTKPTGDFSFGVWFKPDSPANGSKIVGHAGPPHTWAVLMNSGKLTFRLYGTPSDVDVSTTFNVSNGQWYFIVGVVDGTVMRLYVDNILVGSATIPTVNPDAAVFHVGDIATGVSAVGTYDEVNFQNGVAWDFAQIQKLGAMRIDIPRSIVATSQLWFADLLVQGAVPPIPIAHKWVLEKHSDYIFADFGVQAGDQIKIQLHNTATSARILPSEDFDKTYYTTPPAEILHGIGATPTHFALLHDTLGNGKLTPLAPVDFLQADGTKIYTTGFDLLSITVSKPLRIMAAAGKPPFGAGVNFSTGVMTSTTSNEINFTPTNAVIYYVNTNDSVICWGQISGSIAGTGLCRVQLSLPAPLGTAQLEGSGVYSTATKIVPVVIEKISPNARMTWYGDAGNITMRFMFAYLR